MPKLIVRAAFDQAQEMRNLILRADISGRALYYGQVLSLAQDDQDVANMLRMAAAQGVEVKGITYRDRMPESPTRIHALSERGETWTISLLMTALVAAIVLGIVWVLTNTLPYAIMCWLTSVVH